MPLGFKRKVSGIVFFRSLDPAQQRVLLNGAA
jgi:hypothetical protein